MQAPISPKKPLSAPPRWSRWGSLLLVTAVVVVVIARSRHEKAPAGKRAQSERERTGSSYENRALLRSPAPSPGQPTEDLSSIISGTVYGTDGELIAGARVVASTFQSAGNLATPAGSGESDERGHFELRLPEGSYYLNADKEGYGPTFTQAYSGDKVSLILPKSGVIEGHVYDEQHAPMQRFTIALVTVMPDTQAATAPLWSKTFDSPDGSFRINQLPGLAVSVRASAPDKAAAFTPPTRVAPGNTRQIELVLTDGCALSGTVEDKKGTPLPAVFVDAESWVGAGATGDLSVEATSQAKTDMQGRFQLEHVPSGKVLVRGYDGASAVTTTLVDVPSCDNTAPVKLVMSDGGSIAGVVRGGDGTPLAGVRLTVTQKAIGFVNTLSDAEGRYRFDQIPPSTVRLVAERDGQQIARTFTVKDEAVTTQDITLLGQGPGEIRGRVTAGGKPLAGAQLTIAANFGADKGMGLYYPMTGEDGSYRMPALPEGGYVVIVSSTLRVGTAEVKPGEVKTVDLDIADQPAIADRGQPKGTR